MKANRKRKITAVLAAAMAISLATGSVSVFASSKKAGVIGEAKAKQIALNNAGFKEKEVSFVRVALDLEDGRYEYDVEFYKGNMEYDYEIDAKTGKILDVDFDIEDFVIPGHNNNAFITIEKAKQIALDHAKLKAADVKFVKAKLDNDDGKKVYDIEFYKGNAEYDYEIDAKSGKILDFDFDIEDFVIPNNNASITLEKAKQIALSHAGLSASQVTFTKAKTDRDDGRLIYDIEFYTRDGEYDYEIDAKSGKILEYDIDVNDDRDHDDWDDDNDWDDDRDDDDDNDDWDDEWDD